MIETQCIIIMAKITVQNTDISVVKYNEEDYISLTDMARSQLQEHIIPILIVPNSVQLKMRQEAIILCFR